MSDCGVFNLHSFDTAMVKKQTNICSLFVNYWLNYGNEFIDSPHLSIVNGISLLGLQNCRLEFCVRQANNNNNNNY